MEVFTQCASCVVERCSVWGCSSSWRFFSPSCLLLSPVNLLWIRRHTPYGNQTDYRIFELNKRLQNWTEVRRHVRPIKQAHHIAVGQLQSMTAFPFVPPSTSRQECDNLWWDAFTTEFFEDDAMLTITFCLEDGPKRYSKNPRAASLISQRGLLRLD